MDLKFLDYFLQFTLFATSCALAWRWLDNSLVPIPNQLGILGLNIILVLVVKKWIRSKTSSIAITVKKFVVEAFPAVVIARGISSLMIGLLFAFSTFKVLHNIEFLLAEPMSKIPGWEEIGERAYADTTTKSHVSLITCNVKYARKFAPELDSDSNRAKQRRILSRVYGPESIQVAHWFLIQARAYEGIDDFENSKRYTFKALAMYKRLKNDYGQIDALSKLCSIYWLQNNTVAMKDVAQQVRCIAENASTFDEEYEYQHWSRNLYLIDYYLRGVGDQRVCKGLAGLQPKLIKVDEGCTDFEFIGYFLGLCILLTFAGNIADRLLLLKLSRRWLSEIGKSGDSLFVAQRYSRLAIIEHHLGNFEKSDFYSRQQIVVLEAD